MSERLGTRQSPWSALVTAVVYSPRYNISFFGVERLHPFDSRKFGRAWVVLENDLGTALHKHHVPVDRAVADDELLLVHSAEYLRRMRRSRAISPALEVPLVRFLPGWLVRWRVLRPMRWAVRGSVLAAKRALGNGLAINLSGGYHHAKPSAGEGFCIFSDIALIVVQLRAENLLQDTDRVAYIDLDAHQGNGVCHHFHDDRRVVIFDMYNASIYPRQDTIARARIDCDVPLLRRCPGTEYLRLLRERLPGFLDSVGNDGQPALAIYNAGTDVFVEDALGGLCLSAEDVLERDLFVVEEFRRRRIPTVMLLSGGYSARSYQLVAASVRELVVRGEPIRAS